MQPPASRPHGGAFSACGAAAANASSRAESAQRAAQLADLVLEHAVLFGKPLLALGGRFVLLHLLPQASNHAGALRARSGQRGYERGRRQQEK